MSLEAVGQFIVEHKWIITGVAVPLLGTSIAAVALVNRKN